MTKTADRMLTLPEVARRLSVKRDKVSGWIRRGELPAVNVADGPHGQARWRIAPEALDLFLIKRTSTPPVKPVRRRQKQPGVIEFFK